MNGTGKGEERNEGNEMVLRPGNLGGRGWRGATGYLVFRHQTRHPMRGELPLTRLHEVNLGHVRYGGQAQGAVIE